MWCFRLLLLLLLLFCSTRLPTLVSLVLLSSLNLNHIWCSLDPLPTSTALRFHLARLTSRPGFFGWKPRVLWLVDCPMYKSPKQRNPKGYTGVFRNHQCFPLGALTADVGPPWLRRREGAAANGRARGLRRGLQPARRPAAPALGDPIPLWRGSASRRLEKGVSKVRDAWKA